MSYKYSVLSFNFGDYDSLRDPVQVDPECEYVYVTDDPNAKSDKWHVIYTDRFKDKSPIYGSFYVRWHPFEFVHTDKCIILDASIKILRSLSNLIANVFRDDKVVSGIMIQRGDRSWARVKLDFWKKHRDLTDEEYKNAREYIDKNWSNEYRGYLEAAIRIVKNDEINNKINERVWEDCLKLGVNGSPIRLDEIPYTIIVQTEFKNKKIIKYDRRLVQGGYMLFHYHHSDRPLICRLSPKQYAFFCNHKIRLEILEW